MAYEHKPNTGSLFNVENRKNDSWPLYRGSIFITPDMAGRVVEISAFENTSKSGVSYLGLTVKEPYVKDESTSGYEKFKQQGKSLQSKKDVVLEDISDDDDILSQIPF